MFVIEDNITMHLNNNDDNMTMKDVEEVTTNIEETTNEVGNLVIGFDQLDLGEETY